MCLTALSAQSPSSQKLISGGQSKSRLCFPIPWLQQRLQLREWELSVFNFFFFLTVTGQILQLNKAGTVENYRQGTSEWSTLNSDHKRVVLWKRCRRLGWAACRKGKGPCSVGFMKSSENSSWTNGVSVCVCFGLEIKSVWIKILIVVYNFLKRPFNFDFWKKIHHHGFLWCWSWNSNTLATWCEERTHWKTP